MGKWKRKMVPHLSERGCAADLTKQELFVPGAEPNRPTQYGSEQRSSIISNVIIVRVFETIQMITE